MSDHLGQYFEFWVGPQHLLALTPVHGEEQVEEVEGVAGGPQGRPYQTVEVVASGGPLGGLTSQLKQVYWGTTKWSGLARDRLKLEDHLVGPPAPASTRSCCFWGSKVWTCKHTMRVQLGIQKKGLASKQFLGWAGVPQDGLASEQ